MKLSHPSSNNTPFQSFKKTIMKYINYTFTLFVLLMGGLHPLFAQLNESFEGSFPPPGWVLFDNDPTNDPSTYQWSKSTLNANIGNNHAYVRFENNDFIAEDWLVTPKLLPNENNHSLTFYATDDAVTNYGSVYTVRVSTTSQSNISSFDIEASYLETDFIAGMYQQFTVDLIDYIGQEIYIAFVLENDNGDSFYLDDIEGPTVSPIGTVPNCDVSLIIPPNTASVAISSSFKWQAATGDPTGYRLKIGTSSGGEEFLTMTDIGAVTVYRPSMTFDYSTDYYVTILPYNDVGDAVIGTCQEFTFTTRDSPNIILDCANNGPDVDGTLCYRNNSSEEFAISSNNGNQVKISFNTGTVENNVDEFYIYDGIDDTGSLLNARQLYGNAGDFSLLSYTSTTGSLFFRLVSDVNQSCLTGEQTAFSYTASCADCNPPTVSIESTPCNGSNTQFLVKLNIGNLVDGAINVSNSQNGAVQTISSEGLVNVGPFNLGTVSLTLAHSTNPACNILLPSITQDACIPLNDECINATALPLSTDNTCVFSGTTNLATPSEEPFSCNNFAKDIWFSFTPDVTDRYQFNLSTDAIFARINVYEGTCTGGLSSLNDCELNENPIFDLTEMTSYLVQVHNNDNTAMDFNLCVFTVPDAPENDLCGAAIEITNDVTLVAEDVTYATDNDVRICNNNPVGNGLWYQFIGTGRNIDISVSPNTWDAEIQLWSGTNCNQIVCEMVVDNGTTGALEFITEFTTINNQQYYLYVGNFSNIGTPSTFDMTVTFEEPLAVELLNFTGLATEKFNILQWHIANEINMESYLVERSSDGHKNWKKVANLAARNQSNQQRYEWIDEAPLEMGYYRLKSLDLNGDFELSEVIVIKQIKEDNINVFPTPAKDWVMVQYRSSKSASTEWTLTDMTGQLLYRQQMDIAIGMNTINVDLEKFVKGVYIFTIDDGTNRNMVRIIKQ